MKKIIFLFIVSLGFVSNAYSQKTADTAAIEKTGWLVYYLGHAIWFESELTSKVKDKSFFISGKNYKNGLIVDHIGDAKSFQSIAKCYSIMSLTNIDTTTKKGEYTFAESVCIIPVRAKIIYRPKYEPLDLSSISFKRKRSEVTMEYWFLTDYSIQEVKLLRKSDKLKMK